MQGSAPSVSRTPLAARRGALFALAFAMLLLPGCSRRAGGAAPLPQVMTVREFVIPWELTFATDMVVDRSGMVWFSDRFSHSIAVLNPATGDFQSYPTPTPRSAPYGLVLAPDGAIWFAASMVGMLGRVDPATREITEHSIPDARGGPHMLVWHGDEIWFGLRESRGYGRFDPATGTSQVYYLERDRPYSLASGDGSIWMSSFGQFRIVEVDPATGEARVHDLSRVTRLVEDGNPDVAAPPRRWIGEVRRLAVDGQRLWFTDLTRGDLVVFDPSAGSTTAYRALEGASEPYGIARDQRGVIWYGERVGNRISMLDPRTGTRARVAIPTPGSFARQIVIDETRRRVWFTLSDVGRLGVIEYR